MRAKNGIGYENEKEIDGRNVPAWSLATLAVAFFFC